MFEFDIQKSGTSDERLICFLSDSTDQAFRQALKDILEPHGYFCDSDEHHVFMRNLSGEYRLRQLTISSDSWFVWGECDTWGKNIALNQELISWLEQKLLDSGLFKLRQKT